MNSTETLEGHWQCVAAIVNGAPVPEETVRTLRLTLTRTRYTTENDTQVLFDSTYTIDPAFNPKHIAMVGTEGAFAGKEALGIYVVEGDALRMCYRMPGEKRPTTFESLADSKAYFIVWKRRRP